MLCGKMTIEVSFLRERATVRAPLLGTVEWVAVYIVEMGFKKFFGLEGSCFVAASPWARQRAIHESSVETKIDASTNTGGQISLQV